jgi:hypothetical protein
LAGDKAVLYVSFDVRKVAPGNDIELDVAVMHQQKPIIAIQKFALK